MNWSLLESCQLLWSFAKVAIVLLVRIGGNYSHALCGWRKKLSSMEFAL